MVASKAALLLFSVHVKIKVSFERKGSNIVLKLFLNLLTGSQCCLFIREHFLPFKNVVKILIRCQNSFFENLLYFDIVREEQK